MTTQPEALLLADALDAEIQRTVQVDMMHHNAATELRRLSIENEALGLHLSERMKDLARVEAQRDALLEQRDELRRALEIIAVGDATNPQAQAAEELIALGFWTDIPETRAAIAKVEGENHAKNL